MVSKISQFKNQYIFQNIWDISQTIQALPLNLYLKINFFFCLDFNPHLKNETFFRKKIFFM